MTTSLQGGDPRWEITETCKELEPDLVIMGTRGMGKKGFLEGSMAGTPSTFNYPEIKQLFGGPYLANFAYTLDRANTAIAENKADFVAFGSLYIANPDLVERFKLNAALNSPDQATYYGGNEIGYTDYPFLNQPKETSNKQPAATESATS